MAILDKISATSSQISFGVRRLKDTYTGNLIKVERLSDNNQVDVAQDSNNRVSMDSAVSPTTWGATLGAFASGTDAVVVTGYDQSGNGRNVTSTSGSAPYIVKSGALVTNSHGVVVFDTYESGDTTTYKNLSTSYTATQPFTVQGAVQSSGVPQTGQCARLSSSVNCGRSNFGSYRMFAPTQADAYASTNTNNFVPASWVFNGATSKISVNGILREALNPGTSGGSGTADFFYNWTGEAGEMHLFSTALSNDDILIMENDQRAFYVNDDMTDRVLDNLDSIVQSVYSLRKVLKGYTGNAIRVRRTNSTDSGDNAELDIGFDANGDLDISTLESHCSGANNYGYVVNKYDQGSVLDSNGDAEDATQTTNLQQPAIVESGSCLLDENGNPKITTNGIDQYMTLSSIKNATPYSINIVMTKRLQLAGFTDPLSANSFFGNDYILGYATTSDHTTIYFHGTLYKSNTDSQLDNHIIYTNITSATTAATTARLAKRASAIFAKIDVQEIMFFDKDIGATDRGTLETDQESYWINSSTAIDCDMTVVNVVRTTPDPTVLLSLKIDPDTINVTRALLDPTVTVVPNSVDLDFDTINVQRALLDATISLSLELDFDTININRALLDSTVSLSIELDVATINVQRNLLDSTVSIGINLDMSTVNVARALQDPSVIYSIEIDPDTINIVRALPNPDAEVVGGAISIDMDTIDIQRNLLDVGVDIPIDLEMTTLNIARALLDGTVDFNITLDIDTINIERALLDPDLLMSIELDFDTVDITRNLPNPSLTVGDVIQSARITFATKKRRKKFFYDGGEV